MLEAHLFRLTYLDSYLEKSIIGLNCSKLVSSLEACTDLTYSI